MLTKLNHQTTSQQEKLAEITKIIVRALSPEKIICFGSRVSPSQDWSCFTEPGTNNMDIYISFDLLIITRDDEKRQTHEILDIIEQQCNPYVYMNSIVHKLSTVNDAIQKGSRFFSTVYRKGLLVYEENETPLSKPAETTDITASLIKMEQDWRRWYDAADEFLKGSEYYFSRQSYKMVVFMLHQAMESACKAMIRSCTGYLPTTHNIRRLIALTENFSPLPCLIFPGVSIEEEELFQLLQNGYSETRYNEQYVVSENHAATLLRRVRQFAEVAQKVYASQLAALKDTKPISFPLAITYEEV